MSFLYKLTSLPTFFRLLLCLLISLGVHGGAVFYGWVNTPSELKNVTAPLVVSLLDREFAPSVPDDETPEVERPLPVKTAVPRPAAGPPKTAVRAPGLPPEKVTVPAAKAPALEGAEEAATLTCAPEAEGGQSSFEVVAETVPLAELAPQEVQVAVLQDVSPSSRPNEVASASLAFEHELVEAVPNYLSNPLPDYPYLARQKRWEGVVWLLVDVSAAGRVDDLVVEESCGYKILDRAAGKAVRRWQFSPATKAGLAVASHVRIPVRFHLEDD